MMLDMKTHRPPKDVDLRRVEGHDEAAELRLCSDSSEETQRLSVRSRDTVSI